MVASRFTSITIDHFQHPRNIGRMEDADALGRIDDAATDTMVSVYVKFEHSLVARASFRTFGCSACIAASSIATELLVGRDREQLITSDELNAALGGLPADKRYCADLVADAVKKALVG